MIVLVLSHLFPNERDPSSGTFVLEQVKALRNLGVEVFVISPTPWAPRWLKVLPRVRKYLDVRAVSVVDGFTVRRPPVLTLPKDRLQSISGFLFYLSCRRLVRDLLRQNKIDIIHAHTIVPDGFAAVLLGRRFNLPVVSTVHGSDIRIDPFANRFVKAATRWALRRVDRLIGVSRELQNCSFQLGGQRQFAVTHNGADVASFTAINRAEARRVLQLDPDEKIVLFVGYLRPEKAIEDLLNAFALLKRKKTRLCIVGDGPSRQSLNALARKLESSCTFAGAHPHADIPRWLSAADCLVLCSTSEGMPTIVPEAMLCHLPVVVTPVGGIPEIVRDRETGLTVAVHDVPALASAIDSLLSDSEFASGLADRAYNFARENLTWDVNAQNTLALYESVTAIHVPSTQLSSAAHFQRAS